jgi:hypothetical protein
MAGPNLSPSDFARVLEVACKEEFFRIYEDSYYQDASWKDAVMVTSSDGETEYYGFGGRLPVPGRIDEDARIHYGLDDESYSLTNYTYGLAIDIHRKIVEDDRHNYIRQKFQSAAIGHQIKLQENWASLVTGGTAATCHDGQYFFDTDHAGSSNQSNDDQNKAVGTADLATSLSNAIDVLKIMRAFTDPKGSPAHPDALHLQRHRLVLPRPRQARQAVHIPEAHRPRGQRLRARPAYRQLRHQDVRAVPLRLRPVVPCDNRRRLKKEPGEAWPTRAPNSLSLNITDVR